jgi:toxin ParE1/3/4
MKLVIAAEVEAEIDAIVGWYERQRTGLSVDFFAELQAILDEVLLRPLRFAVLGKPKIARQLRRAPLQRFPYNVVFHVQNDEIFVVAVAHTSRKPNYWKKRLG